MSKCRGPVPSSGATPGRSRTDSRVCGASRISRFQAVMFFVGAVTTATAHAAWPERPIRLVIPFAAGASADAYARTAATRLADRLGQQVTVEARPGANGIIATEFVARAQPDGYTLLVVNSSHSINQAVYRKLPYDSIRDFAPIGLIAVPASMMLVAHPSMPANNGRELIDLARARPDQISFGSAGVGNVLHLAGEAFNAAAGVKLLHVPYKGAAPALNDLIAGQVHLMWNAAGLVLPHVKSGKLKAIAAAGKRRAADFPDVPTLDESALPGYAVESWFGILAPAATPPEIVKRLRDETQRVMSLPDAREQLARYGADPPHLTPEEFAVFLKTDAEQTAVIVKRIGLGLDIPK